MQPLLKAENIVSYIGPYTILHDVSLEVTRGEAVVILGRNGAGKTTFLKTIMGLVHTRSGVLEFDGETLVDKETHVIQRKGIGYVPEDYGIFDLLTVEENMRIAMWKEDPETKERCDWVLDLFPDLKLAYKRFAKTLSGGQRQMLSVGRALVNNNRILLVDEPSKGLAPVIIETLAGALKEISKTTTVLLVEQNFAMACAVGQRFYIINEGKTVESGTMADLIQNKELQAVHLGI
ncbi:MAG: ABC transporter ATP-binding protein [Spirochaetaceae bacterium]|nr:MAG: ABC transporter ATP-binding protein [Spirochaetaceae bacterium]